VWRHYPDPRFAFSTVERERPPGGLAAQRQHQHQHQRQRQRQRQRQLQSHDAAAAGSLHLILPRLCAESRLWQQGGGWETSVVGRWWAVGEFAGGGEWVAADA